MLGALGSKGTMDRTDLVVNMHQGHMAAFQIDEASPIAVRAAIAPFLRAAGVPFHSVAARASLEDAAAPASSPSTSAADEIAKLVRLHTEGSLSDGEFAALKAKLLE